MHFEVDSGPGFLKGINAHPRRGWLLRSLLCRYKTSKGSRRCRSRGERNPEVPSSRQVPRAIIGDESGVALVNPGYGFNHV
jgi:hypothetical protein